MISTSINATPFDARWSYLDVVPLPSAPVADFGSNFTEVIEGGTVLFTDLSTNSPYGPTGFVWSFEGGSPVTSSAQTPSVSYGTPGAYDVSLTAFNAAGSDTVTVTDYMTVLPAGCAADEWSVEWFDGTNLSGPVAGSECAPVIDFSFGPFGPAVAPSVGADTFSGRLSKTVTLAAGTYEFTTTSDDGVRVLVDGTPVIDRWVNQAATMYTGTRVLTAGVHTIVVEYYENTGGAVLQAGYSLFGCAASEWSVEWFDGTALAAPVAATQCVTDIDFSFGSGGPVVAPSVGADTFSGRLSKTVTLAAGTYEFTTTSDDGVRVLVDGTPVIDRWVNQAATMYTGTRVLTAGVHTIVVEYYENTGGAVLQAGYSLFGCAASEWSVEWFDGTALAAPVAATQCVTDIDFSFGSGGPVVAPSVGADTFSGRLSKTVTLAAGTYEFTTTSDDGVRVLVDGTPVIDRWVNQAATMYTGTRVLTAGVHTIVVEYYENTGGAVLQAGYSLFGCAASEWSVEWFDGTALAAPVAATQCVTDIDFSFGSGGPVVAPSVGADTFSGRLSKTVTLAAGTYEFTTTSDDGVRVLVDGTPVIDRWVNQAATMYTGTRVLTAGVHTIVVEYYENTGSAVLQANYAPTP